MIWRVFPLFLETSKLAEFILYLNFCSTKMTWWIRKVTQLKIPLVGGHNRRIARDMFFMEHMGVSKNRGGPPKWMVKIMENPIKMDDLGVPLFWKHPYCKNWGRAELWCFSAKINTCSEASQRRHIFEGMLGTDTWMSQEVSKLLGSVGYNPNIPYK